MEVVGRRLHFNSHSASRGGGFPLDLSRSSFLNIAYVNLNKLLNKVSHTELLMRTENVDILGVGETWLVPNVENSFVDICNYKIIRKDSVTNIEKHGVAIYIKEAIKFEEINCQVENLVVIKLLDVDVFLAAAYRPPSNNTEENRKLMDFLRDFCVDKEVVLLGDLNLPSLCWEKENPAESYVRPIDLQFLDAFADAGLTQVVEEPTIFPSGNIIDLCLLSHPERMGSISVLPPLLSTCSHGILHLKYTLQDVQSMKQNINKRIWKRGDYENIARKMGEFEWEVELAGMSTQQMYDKFLTITNSLIDRYVPTAPLKSNKPPWSLNPPRELVRRKSRLFARYKTIRSSMRSRHPDTLESWREFATTNSELKQFAASSQKSYEVSIANQLKTNPKLFHSYLRHRRIGRPSVGPLKLANGNITDDPVRMADRFAESFVGVFTDGIPPNPAANQSSNTVLPEIIITAEDVENEIKTLDINSSPGADGIHPRLLCRCATEFSIPLSMIYNSSLMEGQLPEEWLSSQIAPIFKKGARTDPLNYRPVALTSVPCKVLEKIIVSRLRPYLEGNELLSSEQFGFRSNHSTVDQLIITYNDITAEMDDHSIVDLIFFDYTKAFDKVCHHLLLGKLADIGVNTQLINWIDNFLTARRMQVKIMGSSSRWHRVRSGVPQGSVLGPILFLIYVNHVVHNLFSSYKIFADDIKLYVRGSSRDPAVGLTNLRRDINTFVTTSASWGLEKHS